MAKPKYKGCVYRATLIRTGQAYIGKSLVGMKRRRTVHLCHAADGLKTPFAHALNAYIESAFLWEEIFLSDDDALLKAVEIEQIAAHRARGIKLYNISAGGDGYYGATWTEERRARQQTTYARKRIEGTNRMSPDTRKKISEAAKGRKGPKHTPEVVEKIREAKRAYWAALPPDHPSKLRLREIAIASKGGRIKPPR